MDTRVEAKKTYELHHRLKEERLGKSDNQKQNKDSTE